MTTYWLSDFCVLINSFNIIPFNNKDKNEDFNALTRLIILLTICLYIKYRNEEILMGGLISILCTVIIYLLFTKRSFDTYISEPAVISKNEHPIQTESEHRTKKDIQNLTLTNSIYETGLRSNFSPNKLF